MKKMIVKGGQKMVGEVTIGGAKNSTVALIPAAILADTPVTFDSVPDILDVHNLMVILKSMNVDSHFGHGILKIDPTRIEPNPLPGDAIRSLRASYYFMGALLGKFGHAEVGFPGGDNIGPRPIDQHIKGFEALGAQVKKKKIQLRSQQNPKACTEQGFSLTWFQLEQLSMFCWPLSKQKGQLSWKMLLANRRSLIWQLS
jgi:UDP-N-acetylglucosamine enolpyruvyl transferase